MNGHYEHGAWSRPLYDRERDAVRMFLAQLSQEKHLVLHWMAEDGHCSEEGLVNRVWGNAVERWMRGEEP